MVSFSTYKKMINICRRINNIEQELNSSILIYYGRWRLFLLLLLPLLLSQKVAGRGI
jgi:hypothetical protein